MLKSNVLKFVAAGLAAASVLLVANCGGGGGSGGSGGVLYYPYKTVFGDVCSTFEPTPGCTFLRSDGSRIKVTEDTHYNRCGLGSDCMEYVEFNTCSTFVSPSGICGYVYDPRATVHKRVIAIEDFAGHVGGSYIGVGATGLFWEDVLYGTYWIGKEGVLYSANQGESNYGRAINNKEAGQIADTNLAAAASEANDELIAKGAEHLVSEYGFRPEKAQALASTLNSWAMGVQERGYTTATDMDNTFKASFGGSFTSALAAVKALRAGEPTKMREFTAQTADALGLKPDQAKKFIKASARDALSSFGYNVDNYNW